MTGDRVLLAHGSGGRLMRTFIDQEILPRFGNGPLADLGDGALLDVSCPNLVFSTDSFVVRPLEFPGGDIGELAIYGTINDIAVAGGRPRWLSLSLILEEGLSMEVLRRVLDSVCRAAVHCGVCVATGDTKVVAKGECDGLYINTAGLGEVSPRLVLGADRIIAGDAVLVSGTIGDHGMAVMTARESLRIANGPLSDTGPVHRLVEALAPLGDAVKFLRDPTRGGLAAVLHETTALAGLGVLLHEKCLPLSESSRAVSEILGIDLLHVACEGRVVAFCTDDVASKVLDRWRQFPEGANSARIGTVTDEAGRLVIETAIGTHRLVDIPEGELLPRIC